MHCADPRTGRSQFRWNHRGPSLSPSAFGWPEGSPNHRHSSGSQSTRRPHQSRSTPRSFESAEPPLPAPPGSASQASLPFPRPPRQGPHPPSGRPWPRCALARPKVPWTPFPGPVRWRVGRSSQPSRSTERGYGTQSSRNGQERRRKGEVWEQARGAIAVQAARKKRGKRARIIAPVPA